MKTLLTLVGTLIVVANFATAADEPKKGDKPRLSPEERFKKIDSDSDGAITLEELKASPMGKRNPDKVDGTFKTRDKDADGKLTLEEFSAHGKKDK